MTITADVNAHAYFTTTTSAQYLLTMSVVSGGGTTNPPVGQHYYTSGSLVSMTAYPDYGKVFQKWNINSIETTINPVNVTITGTVSAQAYFIDDITLGVAESVAGRNIANIYPNPSTGLINIQSNSPINRVVITDVVGKNVYDNNNINNKDYSITLADLNSGVYFVKLFTKNETSVYKIQIIK